MYFEKLRYPLHPTFAKEKICIFIFIIGHLIPGAKLIVK